MKTDASGFFWTSCDNICKDAVIGLKDKSKDRGGDSVIDLSYKDKEQTSKTPTCITDWNWGYLGILPVFGPWVKTCDVEGVAVARAGSKQLNRSAQEKQASPSQPINININNTQNNGGEGSPSEKPAH